MIPSRPITQRQIDESIENDIDYKIELAHANDQEQLEWHDEGMEGL